MEPEGRAHAGDLAGTRPQVAPPSVDRQISSCGAPGPDGDEVAADGGDAGGAALGPEGQDRSRTRSARRPSATPPARTRSGPPAAPRLPRPRPDDHEAVVGGDDVLGQGRSVEAGGHDLEPRAAVDRAEHPGPAVDDARADGDRLPAPHDHVGQVEPLHRGALDHQRLERAAVARAPALHHPGLGHGERHDVVPAHRGDGRLTVHRGAEPVRPASPTRSAARPAAGWVRRRHSPTAAASARTTVHDPPPTRDPHVHIDARAVDFVDPKPREG